SEKCRDIPITWSCIDRIILSPWMPPTLTKQVVKTIKEIKGCNRLKVVRSTLIDDEHWKKKGKDATTLAASQSAQAQVTIDVTKVNCDQFVHHKISEPRLIAAWLSGYYNAKRNNRVFDLQSFEENMTKVTNYCSDKKNFKVPVMKAIEQVLGKSN